MAIGLTVLPCKLAMMQTEGLLAFGGAFVTALFAATSLLYARARTAMESGEIFERAEIADECLRLSLLALMGYTITTFVFLDLAERYPRRVGHPLDLKGVTMDWAPAIWAAVCTYLFGVPIAIKIRLVIEGTMKNMGIGPAETPKLELRDLKSRTAETDSDKE